MPGPGECAMNALVVDDDASVRKALTMALETDGYTVTAVENGLAAFDEILQQPFRVILCDIRMPQLAGKSFYEQLEAEFPHIASRVVFVTAWAGDEDTHRFLEQTGQPVLQKPVEVGNLLGIVRQMAEGKGRSSGAF